MQQQTNFLDSLYGKTSPEHSVPTVGKTSAPSLKRSAPSVKRTLMCLDLRAGYGNLLGAYWEMDTVLPGKSMMLSTGESPNAVRESTLSQILQLNVPEKYSLSPKACAGIIRRAEKRGKELPSMLLDALTEVLKLGCGPAAGGTDADDFDEDCEEDEDYQDDDE